jgi:hypothetical protein
VFGFLPHSHPPNPHSLPSSQSSLTPILQILPDSHPASPPSPPSPSQSSQSSNPNLSPQSIDRITRLTWCRSSWQQESVTGWMDARGQSAFNLTFSATLGAQIAAPTRDGVEIALWFGVSDLSRLPGAHRRQKVASASLAMQDMSEDKTSSLASGAVEIRRPRCHGTVSDVVLESCCPPTLRYGVSVALSQITCVGVCVVSVTRCLCSGLVSLVSMDV